VVLPLRNWKQTKSQVGRLGSSVTKSYKNFKVAETKTEKAYRDIKREYYESREAVGNKLADLKRYGVERTITGRKSIYAPKPSEQVKKKVSELRKNY
jgi:hypothetical protein